MEIKTKEELMLAIKSMLPSEIEARKKITTGIATTQDTACVACKEKTPGCCYQPVALSSVEALIIMVGTPELKTRMQELSAQLEFEGKIQNNVEEEKPLDHKVVDAYWSGLGPICFLHKDGRCMAYDVRPVSCMSLWLHSDETSDKCKYSGGGISKLKYLDLNEIQAHFMQEYMRLHHELKIKELLGLDFIIDVETKFGPRMSFMASAIMSCLRAF
jgi:hypothetical protein